MGNLNIQFLDKYKQCDIFIKDAYKSDTGITAYLELMGENEYEGCRIYGWKDDFTQIKHCRWVRNQLSHEVSIETDFCEEYDYEWICDFYYRLMNMDDPMSRLHQYKLDKGRKGNIKSKENQGDYFNSRTNFKSGSKTNKRERNAIKTILIVFGVIAVALLVFLLIYFSN